ncbi:hypothetical protein GCM10011495_35230 [Hymenobacter frigidus]|uniref:GH10 domain-containing protein n=1 Tax=Hymenobacter frigidus TaxID=1524095 RepID=A0ABQ2AD92_9BACT|nr:endo-1,4-beta-xylanase [Hymenobacter frigidus]GGH90107.1 hypothetical protein GCM10011495_35230 [Hymenobacter frigidus]
MRTFTHFLAAAALCMGARAAQAQNAPVVFEAETGVSAGTPIAGAAQGDWAARTIAATGSTPAITYVTSLSDVASISGGGAFPGNANRVLSYTLTFPGAGTYDLYARIRVGAATANDDSFFAGRGFGAKGVATGTDWVNLNGLSSVGYTTGNLAVDGGGAAASGVWKWVNLSKFTANGTVPITYTVGAGSLTQTFQIGAREDGLDFDKFVFGQTGLFFTAANLDAGTQGSTTAPVTFTPTGQPIAAGKSKYLGGIYSQAQLPFFNVYWNQVAPENAGKWGIVESTRNTFNWTELDAAYALAQTSNIPFRMHVLLWGSQQPVWMETLSPADQLIEINQWMAAVAARYPNLDIVEVVNEPTNDPPLIGANSGNTVGSGCGNYYNALGGAGVTGWDWVITAFQLARTHFPNARFMLNDYSVENSNANAQRYLAIINLLVARNLIDAVGIQGHAFSTRPTSAANLTANLNTLASAGKPLYITEMDIDGNNAAGALDDNAQLLEYQRVFPVFWTHPAVRGITMWGYRPGHWRTAQGAYLANADNTERSALVWLRSYVQSTTLGPKASKATAVSIFPNPSTNGRFTLSGTGQLTRLRVLDLQGRLQQDRAVSHQDIIDLQLPAAAGLYLLQLYDAQGFSTGKLVVN